MGQKLAITTWFGAYLVEEGRITLAEKAPIDPDSLDERIALRREGRLTPEEERLVTKLPGTAVSTSDRRLAAHGLLLDPRVRGELPEEVVPPPLELHRESLRRAAHRALDEAWDPSIHIEEAIRAQEDLDRVENLVGERLASWEGRDPPTEIDHPQRRTHEVDPSLVEAREALRRLKEEIRTTHDRLARSIEETLPRKAPNLSGLLGAELAARLMARAGGITRLSRLPAGTIQVLGAERAFFEHLRGRAPPPRHGLLFLHPRVQSAPRSERGKLARALAGKVAIAARLDVAGAPLRPDLAATFDRRATEVRTQRLARRMAAARR
jgi:nucleolar protein 56